MSDPGDHGTKGSGARDSGDGTVPAASGGGLELSQGKSHDYHIGRPPEIDKPYGDLGAIKHQPAYMSSRAVDFALDAIRKLAILRVEESKR
jgi:hypothetical protein